MILLFEGWRIKSYDHGFIVQKKVGSQWKESSYFSSLAQSASYLLEQRIHHETTDLIIDTTNAALSSIAKSKLVTKIEQIKRELLEGI